jgi:hypothetical protein
MTHQHTKRKDSVIAVDCRYVPMLEVSRKHGLTAVANGRAKILDPTDWTTKTIGDVGDHEPIHIIVYPHATAVADTRLAIGHGPIGILRRDNFECQYDDCTHRATTVDHVIPRCQGGATNWGNLVSCCLACNQRKGGRTPAQAGMKLKRPIRSPKWMLFERFYEIVGKTKS